MYTYTIGHDHLNEQQLVSRQVNTRTTGPQTWRFNPLWSWTLAGYLAQLLPCASHAPSQENPAHTQGERFTHTRPASSRAVEVPCQVVGL